MEGFSERIARTERENIGISTIKVHFMKMVGDYETAIINKKDKKIWLVKGYDTKEEALKGHEEICKMTDDEILKLEVIG